MRTRFQSFRIENAGCFVEADVPLDDQGLVFVRGENLDEGDSNGSGKTTLFELLANCVYDKVTKTDRRTKKSDLLNVHHPKDFLTRLNLSVLEEPYSIEKYRLHSELGTGMSIRHGTQDITPDDPREASKAAQNLVGLSWNEYLGSVYLSQRYTHMMIDGTPAQKREYLSRYFGLDTLDVMIKETTKRLNDIPLPDETHLKGMLDSVEQDLADLGDSKTLQESLDALLTEQGDLHTRLVDLKVEQSKQDDARASDEMRKQWRKTLRRMGLLLDPDPLREELRTRRQELVSTKELLTLLKKRNSLLARLAQEEPSTLSPSEVEATLETIGASISKMERDLPKVELREKLSLKLSALPEDSDGLELDVLDARTSKWKLKLEDVQARLTATQSELSQLRGVGDVCYTCQRPISAHEKEEMVAERSQLLDHLRDLLGKAQEAVTYYADQLAVLQARADLLSRISPLPSGSSSALTTAIESLRSRSMELHRASAQIARVHSIRDQLADLQTLECDDPAVYEDKISSLEKTLETLDESYRWVLQYGSSEFDAQAASRTNGAVSNAESKLETLSAKLVTAQEKLARCKTLKRQRSDLRKTLGHTSAEKQRHRVLRYMTLTLGELKKMGLRDSTRLLSTVLPLYLNQLFPDGSIQLSVTDDADGFDLMFNKGGYPIPLTMISGGQAKRVGLAIIFSFAKMGRNTTNLLICDEPFRDLDQKGREACFELLRDFDMGTILVTSHDQDMKSSKKYDQVWSVVMKNHQSRLCLDG